MRLPPLRQRLKAALPFLPRPLPPGLGRLEFVLISRADMSRIHADFLGDPSETDVITFPYGEILLCPAVALAAARARQLTVEDELLLYALHGVLHLAGFDDKTQEQARAMRRAQTKLLIRTKAENSG